MRLDSVQIRTPISIVPELNPSTNFFVGNVHHDTKSPFFIYTLKAITSSYEDIVLQYVRRESKSNSGDGFEFSVIIDRSEMIAYIPAFLDHEE